MPRRKKLTEEIEIGDIVKHSKWGEGTVLSKSGRGEEAKVVVFFSEVGQKKLLIKYAGLKKIGIQPLVQREPESAEEGEVSEEYIEPVEFLPEFTEAREETEEGEVPEEEIAEPEEEESQEE